MLLQSDGTPWRPLVHIRDIINAYLAALTAPVEAIHNQAFNVGRASENYQIRDVANLVAEVVPNCQVAFAAGASPLIPAIYRVSLRRPKPGSPASTRWTLKAGIEELYRAYTGASLHPRPSSSVLASTACKTVKGLQDRGLLSDDLRWR